MTLLVSRVSGHEGLCQPTHLDPYGGKRLGADATGFFKLVGKNRLGWAKLIGAEFHGVVLDGVVYSTEGVYDRSFKPPRDHKKFVKKAKEANGTDGV